MARAKICGLNEPAGVAAAIGDGAAWVGFVFFAKSPRAVSPAGAAALAVKVPAHVGKVGLFVDADDAAIEAALAALPLDLLQLHGNETPERVAAIRARVGRPVMKAFKLAVAEDLAPVAAYEKVADWLLFDAKAAPGKGLGLPGGNGLAFDWTLLQGRQFAKPWMLSGGLDPLNVQPAIRLTGAEAVDVSSGVEDRPGVKNPTKIMAFLNAVRTA